MTYEDGREPITTDQPPAGAELVAAYLATVDDILWHRRAADTPWIGRYIADIDAHGMDVIIHTECGNAYRYDLDDPTLISPAEYAPGDAP